MSPGGSSGLVLSPATLQAPLRFVPVYKSLVWGGRRMAAWRQDLPAGPIGESWDLADHPDGMSVVAEGPLAGRTLGQLTEAAGEALVGRGFAGQSFPLMVKLIDAHQRLSVQVHPDDVLARAMGVGDNGKTECWRVLADGGVIYQGTRPGVDRRAFEQALAAGQLEQTLERFEVQEGDFFFLEGRTVHALGEGCLVYEIQQTSNVTFRVYDWGRVGLDGKPRQLHVAESLQTIDFTRTGFGPRPRQWQQDEHLDEGGVQVRPLVDCPYFQLDERVGGEQKIAGRGAAVVVVALQGEATVSTAGGSVKLPPMTTALVPAAAGDLQIAGPPDLRVLLATPRW